MQSLDDDQAVEVVSIPLAGKSSIADHMVIASGRSTRQVASMATKLAEKIKQDYQRIVRIEGLPTADWVLIDADDVIVHLFRPEVRSFYNLERMWAFGDEDAPRKRRAGARRLTGRACCSTSRARQDRPLARGRAGRSLSEAHRLADQGHRTSRPRRHAARRRPPTSVTVLLDERGETLSSMAFAKKLEGWRDGGKREARFLIGAADGHDDRTRGEADLLLSFGPATWPHMLARAMLAEQLFRATAILANHPYHREG